jgi:hypothetical protein
VGDTGQPPYLSTARRERNISFIKRQTRRMTTVVGECGSNGDKKKETPSLLW